LVAVTLGTTLSSARILAADGGKNLGGLRRTPHGNQFQNICKQCGLHHRPWRHNQRPKPQTQIFQTTSNSASGNSPAEPAMGASFMVGLLLLELRLEKFATLWLLRGLYALTDTDTKAIAEQHLLDDS
jgi:hypothetical protein